MSLADIPFRRIDHVRFFVGNARQSAYFYRNAFGFDVVAYAGLETGVRHEAGYVLRQGRDHVRADLAAPGRSPRHRAADACTATACRTIALEVDDVAAAFEATTVAAAQSPTRRRPAMEDPDGVYRIRRRSAPTATRRTASSTATATTASSRPAISRSTPAATAPARSTPSASRRSTTSSPTSRRARCRSGSTSTSKVHGLLAPGPLRRQGHQHRVLGADVEGRPGRPRAGSSSRSTSRPRAAGGRRSRSSSQFYGGPGVQHIAMATDNIIETRPRHADNDVSFLRVPPAYYELLAGPRRHRSREDLRELAELGILVDRDEEGYLLQIFTKPVEDRPTLFFEIIQRHGAPELRQGELQGPLRGDRARAGAARALCNLESRIERDPRCPLSGIARHANAAARHRQHPRLLRLRAAREDLPAAPRARHGAASGTRCRSSTSRTRRA